MTERDRFEPARAIARALLYEGYALFPYGATSLKNRRRVSFGELSGGGRLRSAIPIVLQPKSMLEGRLAFLQPVERTIVDAQGQRVSELRLSDRDLVSFVEAREIQIPIGPFVPEKLRNGPRVIPFEVDGFESVEAVKDASGATVANIARVGRRISGELRIALTEATDSQHAAVTILSTEVIHLGESAENRELSAMHSVHLAMGLSDGEFVSVIDPPEALREIVESCDFEGWWPIFVGAKGSRDLVLMSPIILYDYPEVAPESHGDLFDATENDELLTLSILALTEEERRAMKAVDPRVAEILSRCDALGERLSELHGATRRFDKHIYVGDAVRLRTEGRDSFDAALNGQLGRVVDIEVEVTGKEHLVVVLDDDPGRDLGLAEHGVGHRFFLARSEVEAVTREEPLQ